MYCTWSTIHILRAVGVNDWRAGGGDDWGRSDRGALRFAPPAYRQLTADKKPLWKASPTPSQRQTASSRSFYATCVRPPRGTLPLLGAGLMRETFHAGHFSSDWIGARRWGGVLRSR